MTPSPALGSSTSIVLLALLVFLIFFIVAWALIERGRQPLLRPLRALNNLRRLIGQSAESGQRVHYSAGSGGLNGQPGSAEALSGLTSLAAASQVAARSKAHLTVSTNDTLTYLVADDVVRSEYVETGRNADYEPTDLRFITQQDRLAYITGVTSILGEKQTSASVMLGRFDAEYLLAGDQANRRNLPQVVGSSRLEAMPLMIASAGPDNTLIGEEMYAAPAYLDRQPVHLASLLAQDWARLLLILIIIVGVLLTSLGLVPDIANNFLR